MKRFYKLVSVEKTDAGFAVLLDGRPVRTPARAALVLPTAALAEAIAQEWRDQGDIVAPAAMPLLRLANTTLDGIGVARDATIAAILRFGEHDLLCYRSDAPELAARQDAAWTPMLDWAATALDARLVTTSGVDPVAQPPQALAALERAIAAQDDFALAGLHVAASITGSLVLGLAMAQGVITAADAFARARIDETWQAETWGADHEAVQRGHRLSAEIADAARLIALSR